MLARWSAIGGEPGESWWKRQVDARGARLRSPRSRTSSASSFARCVAPGSEPLRPRMSRRRHPPHPGTWRGSSVCVDREAAPACNDEQVVYEISASPGKPNTVTAKADKVVDGKRVPMGALDFTHDPTDGTWMTDFETPRAHALWRLTVSGTKMTGVLTLLPSKAVVRRMDLRKDGGPAPASGPPGARLGQ
jgi:hypothetical protein